MDVGDGATVMAAGAGAGADSDERAAASEASLDALAARVDWWPVLPCAARKLCHEDCHGARKSGSTHPTLKSTAAKMPHARRPPISYSSPPRNGDCA
jgi:hypothetical protein